MVAALFTVVLFYESISTRFVPTERLEEKSLAERQAEYHFIDDIIRINPLSGVGIGAYTVAFAGVLPNFPIWTYQPIHNSFALIFAEIGLIGAIGVLLFLYALFRELPKTASTFSFIGLLTTLALFDHYLWSNWSGLVLLAFAFAMILRLKEKA